MELENRVDAFVRHYGIFTEGSRIVVACSGGPDSLALASVLLALRDRWRLVLRIAHFEHGIRGEASAVDAEFVRSFAEANGLPFDVAHEDIPAYARQSGLSLETAARERRYAFLEQVARVTGEDSLIATGHHREDQAETVLMHILRGSGADGLAGMRPRRGTRIRPLLAFSRQDIMHYLNEKGLTPCWDETNFQANTARNRMRLEIMPSLRRYSPAVEDVLCRLAAAEAEIADFLRESADAVWDKIVDERDGKFFLQRPEYRNQPVAVRKAILRRLAEEAGLRQSLGYLHYDALDEFCRCSETGKVLSLPCNHVAECQYDRVLLRRQADVPEAWDETTVSISGTTRIEGAGLTIYASAWSHGDMPKNADIAVIDAEAITLPLTVRRRRDGDSFRLKGGGRKKVKSLLIDKKVPRALRGRVPIFSAGGEILWIGGLQRAAFALVTEETKNAVMLRLEWDDSTCTKGEVRS